VSDTLQWLAVAQICLKFAAAAQLGLQGCGNADQGIYGLICSFYQTELSIVGQIQTDKLQPHLHRNLPMGFLPSGSNNDNNCK